MENKKLIYLDNAATTRMDERVISAMLPYMREGYGNAGGKYSLGFEASKTVRSARESAASLIGAEPDEIYFNSGGTEGNNTVLSGFCPDGFPESAKTVVTSMVEHSSVLEPLKEKTERGRKTIYIRPESDGSIGSGRLNEILERSEKTGQGCGLVSVMFVNNETGTLMPVKELARTAHSHGFLFHTDAVGAIGHIPIDVKESEIDFLTVSAHKFYGPKGMGFLYKRRGVNCSPLIYGGGQEKGFRSGTENVAGIAGLGKACEIAAAELKLNEAHIKGLSEMLKEMVFRDIPLIKQNGRGERILNFSFEGVSGASLALRLDIEGICVSTGAACSMGKDEPSHVLCAMGLSKEEADSSLRISLGKYNNKEEIGIFCETLKKLVCELRSIGGFKL